jgi:hypothetical protein
MSLIFNENGYEWMRLRFTKWTQVAAKNSAVKIAATQNAE